MTAQTLFYPQNSIQLEMISFFTALEAPHPERPNYQNKNKESLLEMQIRTFTITNLSSPKSSQAKGQINNNTL